MDNLKFDKLSDFASTPETPFIRLDEVEYKKYWMKDKPMEVVDQSGEVLSLTRPGKLITGFQDRASYTKLFKGGKLKLAELSSSGIKVLCYIMLNASPNQEDMCLHPQQVASEMGYRDQRSVYEGLVNLLNMGLLGRKTGYQSCFWINPNLFFNGDRIKLLDNPVRADFVQELISKHTKEAKEYANSAKD